MARGWESKSVEAQQEEVQRGQPERARLTREEADRLGKKGNLQLSLKDVLEKLEQSRDERYRKMLEQAKADLERQIQTLSR
jgi:hypothetical protein